jgi:hypothetical protein
VLKLSRSRTETFAREVESLTARRVNLALPLVRLSEATGEFEGLLALRPSESDHQDEKVFLQLKNEVQPAMLRELESKGTVDVLSQVQQQDRINQALILRTETARMSIWNRQGLIKSPEAVPAFAFAKTEDLAHSLDDALRQRQGDLREMNFKALPAFDHMAIFYQEGAGFEPFTLAESEFFKQAYEARVAQRGDNLDPLRLMKEPTTAAKEAGQ